MISRRQFLGVAAAGIVRLKPDTTDARTTATWTNQPDSGLQGGEEDQPNFGSVRLQPDRRVGKPRASEFVFARLRYDSGDWDYNPKVAANVLDSVMQYTSIPVYHEEVVI